MDEPGITELINSEQGDLSASQRFDMEAVYRQLKKIAHVQRFKIQSHGLNTTALVNEAWLKTHASRDTFKNRNHFFAYCALAMRHILLDRARRNKLITYVGNDQAFDGEPAFLQSDFLIDLDRHLSRLGRNAPRLEKIFTCRFYGEMAFEDIAELLEISDRTVIRDWNKARAMLAVAMEQSPT